jgi:UDP-N-acetylmuramate dehydrogenase
MQIQENISLKSRNTFGIDVKARRYAVFTDLEELTKLAAQFRPSKLLILGGGSNVLFTRDYDGLVLANGIKGIELIREDEHHLYVRAGGGENWSQFVAYCVRRGWAGVENLSLIPGDVGASPIQNIGAYGVELKEVFYELDAFHLQDRKVFAFSVNDCQFGYRDSVFKHRLKGQYVIVNVTLRLNKIPLFNTRYGSVEEELKKMGTRQLSIQAIAQAVINIRSAKLPDPAKIPNAGSFFKNPTVNKATFQKLREGHPAIVGYENGDGSMKLAAGWLIEQCGWKGFRKGDAGCHTHQALVLVNYGHASGQDILDLSQEIVHSVKNRYGVELVREVQVI